VTRIHASTIWTVLIAFAVTGMLPVGSYYFFKHLMTGTVTHENARVVFEEFQKKLDQGAIIRDPLTAEHVADIAYREKEKTGALDGWDNPMRIAAVMQGKSCKLIVTSAGPDAAFGTADDIPMEKTFDMSGRKKMIEPR
jgi:hypothetical protein